MNTDLNIDENEEEKAKVFTFPTVIQGGKMPPSANWLRNLTPNTVFLCRPRMPDDGFVFLLQRHVIFHTDGGTLLLDNLNTEVMRFYVDTQRFSDKMELVEVLQEG